MPTQVSAGPRATVVIPVRNRAGSLAAVLDGLADQRLPQDAFEVVVSDDGSTDETPDVVRRREGALPVRFLPGPRDAGPWRAGLVRNRGLFAARGDVVIFLDSDVIPGPGFVGAHLAAHEREREPQAVAGYLFGYPADPRRRDPSVLQPPPIDEMLDRLPERLAVAPDDWCDGRERELALWPDLQDCPWRWQYFWSANISVGRELAHRLGGFDTDFVGWGFEDVELGYRLVEAGAVLRLERSAWGVHYPHPTRVTRENARAERENVDRMLIKHGAPGLELSSWVALTEQPETVSLPVALEVATLLAERPQLTPLEAPLARVLRERWDVGAPRQTLLIGAATPEASQPLGVAMHLDPSRPPRPPRPSEPSLARGDGAPGFFGIFLPCADRVFADAILVDLWQRVSPDTALVLLGEALRVAARALLVAPGAPGPLDTTWLPAESRWEEVVVEGGRVLIVTAIGRLAGEA